MVDARRLAEVIMLHRLTGAWKALTAANPQTDAPSPDAARRQAEALTSEVGAPTLTGVRSIWSEDQAIGLTPRRLGALLRAAEQGDAAAYLDLAERIEEHYWHYRAVLATRKLSVAQLPVTVEAASDAPIDVAAADLVRELIDGDAFDQTVFDILDGLGKGFSATEIVWDTSGGEWRIDRLIWRDPRWFAFDPADGTTLLLRTEAAPQGEPLAPNKWIVHRPKTKSGIPIRAGLARPAAWAYLFQSFGWKDWLSFVETYGQPLRLGKYGAGASPEEKRTLLNAVRNVAADAGAIIPATMDLEFVTAGSQASGDTFDQLIERLDLNVSKLVLGQTTTTDAVSGGHAVSQEHRLVQEDIERADARQLAATLRRDLVAPLVRFNLGPQAASPKLRIGQPATEDLQLTLSAVKDLVPLGLKVGMSTVRDKFGLPDPAPDEELLTPAIPAPNATATAAAQPVPDAPQDDIDALVKDLLADWTATLDPLVTPIVTAAAQAKDAQDFLDRLAALAADDGVVDVLRERLARGAFAARTGARLGLAKGGSNADG
jgi:phage gp29-like protein